ncbi:DUF3096 domain-containing protein [Thioclava indica]|uniref:DUF3096 domain-containing protein n=1 Tax=Thioclava indica TaxID=1353528 RepID=A0A074JXU3_9RHOB|nr:DUF3096 domain-containing protein [Thioclava indica]KEO60690.1 hypothetical protein DT23_12670 [Thioclava indica]
MVYSGSMAMLAPIMALFAGVLILIFPRLLSYIVAVYLIAIGLAGLFPMMMISGPMG